MACEGDPIGLHAGDPGSRVRKILVSLDAGMRAIEHAVKNKCQMLVTHHPRFYQPLKNLDETTPMGELATTIARGGLAVYCAHTNLDTAPGGVNDVLAHMVGLETGIPISIHARDPMLKLVVFVPDSHLHVVREAMCDAGAGIIGEYDDCSFRTAGIGTFRGSADSNPYLGMAGKFEEAEEWRLEVILPQSSRASVEQALRREHPYEEPAFDLYRLARSDEFGLGRVGELAKPATLGRLARKLKRKCGAQSVQVLGDADKPLKRVAVWSGGGCPAQDIISLNVDAVILGEAGYHDLELLEQAKVACVALGHGPCEEIVLEPLAENLRQALPGIKVEVLACAPRMWSV